MFACTRGSRRAAAPDAPSGDPGSMRTVAADGTSSSRNALRWIRTVCPSYSATSCHPPSVCADSTSPSRLCSSRFVRLFPVMRTTDPRGSTASEVLPPPRGRVTVRGDEARFRAALARAAGSSAASPVSSSRNTRGAAAACAPAAHSGRAAGGSASAYSGAPNGASPGTGAAGTGGAAAPNTRLSASVVAGQLKRRDRRDRRDDAEPMGAVGVRGMARI